MGTYVTSQRVFTTSNSQWTPVFGNTRVNAWVQGIGNDQDTVVRQRWHARVTYASPGTTNNPNWVGAAEVRLMVQFSPDGTMPDVDDVASDNPHTMGFQDLHMLRFPNPPGPAVAGHLVQWESDPAGMVIETSRKGDGVSGVPPQIGCGIFAVDQTTGFTLGLEPAALIRVQITAKMWWKTNAF